MLGFHTIFDLSSGVAWVGITLQGPGSDGVGTFWPGHISSVITRGNAQSSTSHGLRGNEGITNLAEFSGSKSGMESLFWSKQLRVTKTEVSNLKRAYANLSLVPRDRQRTRDLGKPCGALGHSQTVQDICSEGLYSDPAIFDPQNTLFFHPPRIWMVRGIQFY